MTLLEIIIVANNILGIGELTMNKPIVLIHGAGDSARIWHLQMEQLSGRRIFAIDLPGHGQRMDSLPPEASVLDYAKAVHEIIQQELKLFHPIIAGHSLGGAVALTMALEYGSELGGLILISAGARFRIHPVLLESARTIPQQALLQLKEIGLTPTNAITLATVMVNEQATPSPNILYRDLTAFNAFDIMARTSEIRLPTLIICGAEDRFMPVKYSQYLYDHIEGSTLRVIPNAGHYVMREQTELVNHILEEWLKQQ